jgi:hypothetical protein
MALSNMLKEPRREITETAVGLGLLAFLPVSDLIFALWLTHGDTDPRHTLWTAMEMVALSGVIPLCGLVIVLVVGYVALQLVHAIGEFACNVLELRGVHLRPRTRR